MHYTLDIDINLPKAKVVELFENPDNLRHWQKGFISMTHVEGESGAVGAKSKLNYKMGKRDVEMIETIIINNLPDEFNATYEAKGVWNLIENSFISLDANTTQWKTSNTFKFKGIMKIFALLMPSAFKKQSMVFLHDFKSFAEKV